MSLSAFYPRRNNSAIVVEAESSEELKHLESVIEVGLSHFRAAGEALQTIRERKLFQPRFTTFQEYVATRWGMSYAHAARLIEAAAVVSNLVESGAVNLPKVESHARALARLEPADQVQVWNEVTSTTPSEEVTAEALEAAAERRTPKRSRRKAPKAIKLKGKGWTLTLERKSVEVDPVAVLQDAIAQLSQKRAAA